MTYLTEFIFPINSRQESIAIYYRGEGRYMLVSRGRFLLTERHPLVSDALEVTRL